MIFIKIFQKQLIKKINNYYKKKVYVKNYKDNYNKYNKKVNPKNKLVNKCKIYNYKCKMFQRKFLN